MDWLSPDESGIGWTRDGVPYVAWEPSVPSVAPPASYALPPLTIAPGALDIFNLPAPVPSIASRPSYRAEPAAFDDPAPLYVKLTKPTWYNSAKGAAMDYSDDRYNYVDPLLSLAPESPNYGARGYVDPLGPYYGGVDPSYQVFNLSDAAMATQRLFPGWTLPRIGIPALGFPNTPKATQQQAAPASTLTTYLIYGALALAVILLVKR